jgi:vanillate/4-hydroxybenzoate decarboxylase subunit D
VSEGSPCPRCRGTDTAVLATSPIDGVWIVTGCATCTYSWRSSEPVRASTAEHYPVRFRLTVDEIASAQESPPVASGAPVHR